ncbi:c-type cytochrome [Deinococcus navajonensis]|uniref:C-type cytochrome n=1 Tax=Deinococcus navajonensis TaxID=309884 RepID=A0ABV8XPE2_9DEIO
MILSLLLLGLILLAAGALVLSPLRAAAAADPDAEQRTALEAQRDRLYAELAALNPDEPADEARRPDLERRAALTLRALDGLAPAPRAPLRTGPRRVALLGVGLAALLTVAGAVTFVPRWQLKALDPGEAQDVLAVLNLPRLKAEAERTQANAAYMAWGKAAFDSGTYDQALTAYGHALKLEPRQPEALRRLGILLLTSEERTSRKLSTEDATQAALLIRTAAQLAPNDPESQLLLGFAYARFGEDRQALEALERYRTLDPKGRDADEMITALRARQNTSDPVLRVYAANCASCHGPAGAGGLGPSLRESTLSRAALRRIIVQGKGAMPAYPNLSAAQLEGLLDLIERWQKEGQ